MRKGVAVNAGIEGHSTVTLGIDMGSTLAKVVAISVGGEVVATAERAVGNWEEDTAGILLTEVADSLGEPRGFGCIVSTGVGRLGVDFADVSANEIFCHAKGASAWLSGPGVVVDLGGGESRIVLLERNGQVEDFVADGGWTGGMHRLLKLLSAALGTDVRDLGLAHNPVGEVLELDERSLQHAEQEILLLLAQGRPPADLVSAVYGSIARRLAKLFSRFVKDLDGRPLLVSGGLALNEGIVIALREALHVPVVVLPDPLHMGALGAALIGRERLGADLGLAR